VGVSPTPLFVVCPFSSESQGVWCVCEKSGLRAPLWAWVVGRHVSIGSLCEVSVEGPPGATQLQLAAVEASRLEGALRTAEAATPGAPSPLLPLLQYRIWFGAFGPAALCAGVRQRSARGSSCGTRPPPWPLPTRHEERPDRNRLSSNVWMLRFKATEFFWVLFLGQFFLTPIFWVPRDPAPPPRGGTNDPAPWVGPGRTPPPGLKKKPVPNDPLPRGSFKQKPGLESGCQAIRGRKPRRKGDPPKEVGGGLRGRRSGRRRRRGGWRRTSEPPGSSSRRAAARGGRGPGPRRPPWTACGRATRRRARRIVRVVMVGRGPLGGGGLPCQSRRLRIAEQQWPRLWHPWWVCDYAQGTWCNPVCGAHSSIRLRV